MNNAHRRLADAFRPTAFLILALLFVTAAELTVAAQRPRTILPSPTPTPAAVVRPTATPAPLQSLGDLQSTIRQKLFSPEVRRGRIGIKVVSLKSGAVVFENDSEKYFMPASNQKNFTVAAALERLGPDFKFVTSVFADARPDANGTVSGDLRIFGRGDVSISTAFFTSAANDPNAYYKGIDRLVDAIAAAGVRRIEGSIVGDESYYRGFHIPETWEWDDLQWYYGAEMSALPINDNAVDLRVRPGVSGGPCNVTISPPNTSFQIVNTCTTTGSSVKRNLNVHKKIDRNVLEISGTLPAGDDGFNRPIAITGPAELFVSMLKQRLDARGITVTGGSRLKPANIPSPASQMEIAKLESPPLSLIAGKTMKPSQNMYTETLLWTLGEQVGRTTTSSQTSAALGLDVLRSFLRQAGIPDDGIVPYDGSGLSRHNLITPAAVVTLYDFMAKRSRSPQAWRDSLTIGGIDGTLRNRFKGTRAENNARGKTGTIDQVSALSGYVTTAGGEELIFAIAVNGVAVTSTRVSLIDEIVVAIANFNGRVDQ